MRSASVIEPVASVGGGLLADTVTSLFGITIPPRSSDEAYPRTVAKRSGSKARITII